MRSGAVPCVPSAAAALPPSPPSPSPPTPSFLLPLALTTNTASNQDLPVDASNVCEVQWRSVRLEDSSISDVSILRGPKSLRDFLQALSCLPSRSLLVTRSATELRQIVHPQLVREGFVAPPLLLRYVDVSAVSVECGQPPLDFSLPLEENLQALTERVLSLPRERLLGRVEEVRLGLEHAVCDRDTEVEKDVVVRTRGLPWQASDSHVADFFAGLNLAPGGVALCLSAEGRRNGEALVRFTSPEMRELALRRHRHFLLSRYIEVYRAASEDFLQVAAGSSSEAVLFVSRGAAMIVRCRGLPYDVTAQQIKEFFAAGPDGCEVMEEGILFVTKADGRATGDAFVLFNSEEDGLKALAKHKQTIGSRYIELFRSTQAEVQQVVSRSQELGVVTTANGKKDCVRLRGLPYEATVESVVEFLGESARGIALQGVHMVYNAQGHPSGEAFIQASLSPLPSLPQMRSEAAAAATASMAHNKFMNVGKKQRYIEVFQCSAEDMNLVVATASPPPAAPAPAAPPQTPLLLPRPPVFSNPQLPYTPYWPYPSPPVSPNMLLSQTGGHILLTGIGPSVTPQDIFAYFQSTPELRVESVQMLRWGTAGCPGEALVRVRAREPGVAPLVEAAFPLIHT